MCAWSTENSVGIVTGYGLANCVVGVPFLAEARFFCIPQCPDRLWDPPSLLSNEYQGLFPGWYSGWGVKLATHLHLVPRSRIVELYLHSPICLHDIVLN
jgi:hypothetical protein